MILFFLTVTKDDYSGLTRTISSVQQLETDFEIVHLVKNGRSNDISSRYIRSLVNSSITYILDESPDSSIYDAMNAALSFVPANSYYVFLNSGDLIKGNLRSIPSTPFFLLPSFKSSPTNNINTLLSPIPIKKSYFNGMPFCHQSLFCQKCSNHRFSCTYSISADYKYVLDFVSDLFPSPVDIPIVSSAYIIFDTSGISTQRKLLRDYEGFLIASTKGLMFFILFVFCRLIRLPYYLYYLIHKVFRNYVF